MNNINCIICGLDSKEIVIEENGYNGKICRQCNLIYISPRPEENSIYKIYTKDRLLDYAYSIIQYEYDKRLISQNTIGIIKKYKNKGNILEIGAGAGYFLDEARKNGYNVYSIELNNVLNRYIIDKYSIISEDNQLNDNSFGGLKFDIIYHCNVLSHLYDPIKEYKKYYNKLEQNGILVFETGNIGDVNEIYYKEYDSFEYPDHLYFFGKKSINKLLDMCGFEIVKYYEYSMSPFNIYNNIKKKCYDVVYHKKNYNDKFIHTTNYDEQNCHVMYLSIFKKIGSIIKYILIYKIGKYCIKIKRPQTIVVVSKKK